MGQLFLVIIGVLALSLYALADSPKEVDLPTAFAVITKNKKFNATWSSGKEFYYETYESTLRAFDAETKSFRNVATSEVLTKWEGAGYTLSPDNKKILVQYGQEPVSTHSTNANYDLYDAEKKQTHKISNGKKIQSIVWSPSGDKLAFVTENNVYVRQSDGKEVQLTKNGKAGEIYNGVPDFIYEEEVFQSNPVLWFSPDGTKLAFAHFDDSQVKTYPNIVYGNPGTVENQYPKLVDQKFPAAGTQNPKVRVLIADLKTPTKAAVELTAPTDIVTDDHILGSATWADKDHILVKWLNRLQNVASFQLCDASGKCKQVTKLEEPKGWIEANVKECLPSGNNCILLNWIGNWYQLWNLDLKTGKNTWESLGDKISVTNFYCYKESSKDLYYQATVPEDQNQLHVYKNKKCISCSLKDADKLPCKHASAVFSKDLSYYVLSCSGPSMHYSKVYDSKTDSSIYDWELNQQGREEMKQIASPQIELIQVPLSEGMQASVKIFLPPSLEAGKKYPLLIDSKGVAANSVFLSNEFEYGWNGYLSAGPQIILAQIEGRGTGNKGKDVLYSIKGRLGTSDVQDHFDILKHLQKKYSQIDPKRIGIWGVNAAGLSAGLVLAKDPTKIFKCAILHQPLASYIYYDTIYTERYLGLPTNEENMKSYEAADLTRNVTNISGHELLIIHGNGGKNVHDFSSMMIAHALEKGNVPFEQMIYPDSDETVSQYLLHWVTGMDKFWKRCFDLKSK